MALCSGPAIVLNPFGEPARSPARAFASERDVVIGDAIPPTFFRGWRFVVGFIGLVVEQTAIRPIARWRDGEADFCGCALADLRDPACADLDRDGLCIGRIGCGLIEPCHESGDGLARPAKLPNSYT